MILSVLLISLIACPSAVQGTAEDLAALTSADAAARELATRRLCGSLPPEHQRALLELAVGADPELFRRITRVLAARDERLPLAVELASHEDSKARGIGRAAFLELLGRWSTSFDDAPLPSHRARQLIQEAQQGLLIIPPSQGALLPLLERLAEEASFGIPVVIDPGIRGGLEGSWDPSPGTPLDQLERVCLRNGLTYELRGPASERDIVHSRLGHWLRVCAGRDATGDPTREVLLTWSLEVARGGEGAPAAARALATTGWPAPLAWFSERWRSEEDPVALEGLLASAARDRVALVLTQTETHLRARERLDRLATEGSDMGSSWELERIARGMARAGARAPSGADPSEVWSVVGAAAPSSAIWARLLVLEGHRRGDRPLTREVLASGGGGDALLWRRALRAYVSDLGREPMPIPLGDVVHILRTGHTEGLGRLLHAAGVRSSDLEEFEGVELLAAELSLREGNESACGASLHEGWIGPACSEEEVEVLLSAWCAEFGRSRVARAVAGVEPVDELEASWMRLLELSGVLAPGATGDPGEDLQLLACRAGGRGGALVRGVLLEEFEGRSTEALQGVKELAEAWRRVGWALQEAGEEDLIRSFAAQTRLLIQDREVQMKLLESFPPTPRGLLEPLDVGLQRSSEPR